jgi:hypothetical protein
MSRLAAGILTGGGVPGNDAFTKILLHMDGANGGTTFTDDNAGGVSATWSASGTAPITTTAFLKFGTASYQGNSNGFIKSNQNSVYNPGSSDFTIDFWLRGTVASALQYIASFGNTSLTQDYAWSMFYGSDNTLRGGFLNTANSNIQANAGVVSIMDGNWHHIAMVKTSSSVKIYIDGVATGTPATSSGTVKSGGSYTMMVGFDVQGFGSTKFRGNLDEFRYSVGIARWTSNFSPPTGPYS